MTAWLKFAKVISNRKEVLLHGRQFGFVGRWIHSTQLSQVCANRYPKVTQIRRAFYHYFSHLAQTAPQITVIAPFSFFSVLKSFKCGFLKSRGERQHVTLKKINFLWRATWKSEFCMVHFTSILFITLPPHFNLTVNIIFNVQHPPTEASPQIIDWAALWSCPSLTTDFQNMLSNERDGQACQQNAQQFALPNTKVRKVFTCLGHFHSVFLNAIMQKKIKLSHVLSLKRQAISKHCWDVN